MSDELRGNLVSAGTLTGSVNTDNTMTGNLAAVLGRDGKDGKSAYQVAVDNGFKGTEAEWLASLKANIPNGSIDPDKLDRNYWEYTKSSFVETASGLLNMLTEKQIMRVKALNGSTLYSQLGDNEAIAIKTADGFSLFDLNDAKRYKYDNMGGLEEIQKIGNGDIYHEFFFSESMIAKYFSLPVVAKIAPDDATDTWFNTLTTPGIYQVRFQNDSCVVIVLKPDTSVHLMQLRLSHNKFEYRSCHTDVANNYFADCWTGWVDLTDSDFTNAKTFSGLDEMRAYSFDEDTLYHFKSSAQVGSLVGNGYCYGRYYIGDRNVKMMEIFNSTTHSTWKLNITEGTAELIKTSSGGGEGKSAYEIALDNGFKGTEAEWLASLKGEKGDKGDRGNSGVYIGSGDMPDDCNVQIDPTGEAVDLSEFAKKEYVDNAIENIETGGASGSGSSETLVFEQKWENHIAHTVTAIDFENFTMTLDDTTGIPTDTTGKPQSYIQLDMFGGNAILMNVVPIELVNKGFKVQAIGDNKVQFLDNSNTVIQFTDTGNIDLTKFKLCVYDKPYSQMKVENLETNHKYHVVYDFEGFHHQTAAIGLPECVADVNGGYAINGLRSMLQYGLYTNGFNAYNDTISFRSCGEGVNGFTSLTLPAKLDVYITPELYNGQKRVLLEIEGIYFSYNNTSYKISSYCVYANGWANNEVSKIVFKAGNAGWHGNAKARIYDCGEVDLW